MPAPLYPKPIRWWPAIAIGALILIVLSAIWIPDRPDRQMQVMPTILVCSIGSILLCLWFFAFSRMSQPIRLRGLSILILLIILGVSLFQIRGFTGDLTPKIEWRWSSVTSISMAGQSSDGPDIDYPQFLGPHRNATLEGIELESDWSQHPPKLLWRVPVGEAYSAFAVVGSSAVTQEQKGEDETVACYDLLTGKEKWRHSARARYGTAIAGIGPRATPTISGDRVYSFGATGILTCLDLETGREIWSRDTVKETDARVKEWGISGSPLVLYDKVIVSPGGKNEQSLMAYHRETGNIIWGGGRMRAGHSSPSLVSIAEMDQILIFNRGQVAGHDPNSGKLLWEYPWNEMTQHVAQPIPLPDDRIFVSTGYGIGSELIQISKNSQDEFTAERIWKSPRLKAKFANMVYKDGYIYGLDDGVLVCLDLADGQRKWKRGRYGHGQLILVDDLLLIQTESGDVVLVDASPIEHNERARFPALSNHTWNAPTLAAPYLLVRNDREAACYELALKN
ncbi:MAG: PQQ-like beta-propeller repeat protein [Candidatus Latescibacteria bacterium]|nr:PQQ-like beta-propeller repeat protein [Candidatus Latescibacterota bacterium]